MDANEYLLECLVREHLDIQRATARRAALASAARRPRPWRAVIGLALIRLGRALAGEPARRPRHA